VLLVRRGLGVEEWGHRLEFAEPVDMDKGGLSGSKAAQVGDAEEFIFMFDTDAVYAGEGGNKF